MINMKIKLNKLIGLVTGMFLLLVSLNSCVKNRNASATDFSQLQDHVVLLNGGLVNFSAANISFSNGDTTTVTLIVDLASVNLPTSPVKVTIGVDGPQVNSYNASSGKSFQLAPANAYSISSTTLTIPAGQQYASITVSFYKPALDPAASYLLPISITDASGKALTSNQNTIFYNIIGNVLAGNYLHSYYRYNGTTDTTKAPNSTVGINVPATIGAVNSISVLLPEYYLEANFGLGVVLSFVNNNGVLSNFTVSLDANTQATLVANSFLVPTLKLAGYQIVGNASTKYAGSTFRVYIEVINNAGALRAIIDNFVKQ